MPFQITLDYLHLVSPRGEDRENFYKAEVSLLYGALLRTGVATSFVLQKYLLRSKSSVLGQMHKLNKVIQNKKGESYFGLPEEITVWLGSFMLAKNVFCVLYPI